MNISIRISVLFSLLLSMTGYSQLSIVNSNLLPYNVTGQSMLQTTVLSTGGEGTVRVKSFISNSAGKRVYTVESGVISIKTGANNIAALVGNAFIEKYSSLPQSKYVQTHHRLPSGLYTHCIVIEPLTGFEEGDELCNDIDASDMTFLSLVYPSDNDTIETNNPILTWTHSESFSLLNEGEHFKIIVVEMKDDQGAEEAVTTNQPVFTKSFLRSHQVQYPFDAKELEKGKNYAWQVQKLSRGTIVNKTEAWEFTLKPDPEVHEHMFTTLKTSLDASFYHVYNDKIYFRYDEKYKGGDIQIRILNERRHEIKPTLESTDGAAQNMKSAGYNQYILDLEPYNLERGFYIMECRNEKKEVYLLKFYVAE